MSAILSEGYNERLFSGDALRRFYHLSRYRWLKARVAADLPGPIRMVELGCFDGKTLDWLPHPPECYVGLDANWEGGLDEGRRAFAGREEVTLIEAHSADALKAYADGAFNVAAALETLEHIPDDAMRDYLAELARVTDGFFYASVPNEMGPVFLGKFLVKHLAYGGSESYSAREVVAATLRQPHKVRRDQHKGFDYRALVRDVAEHFDVVRVEGIPFSSVPPAVSLTVGITARSRRSR